MCNNVKILIIGAGAAGFAAASRLLREGFKNIIILEASDRIGGRIHTAEFSESYVELGAEFVHGEKGNIIYELASPHNVLESSNNAFQPSTLTFVDSKGEIIPVNESAPAVSIYYDIERIMMNDSKNLTGSYGTYVIRKFYEAFNEESFTSSERAKQLLEWLNKFDSSLQCSDTWFDVSAKRLLEYWSCDGDRVMPWKTPGYKTLFDLLTLKGSKGNDRLEIENKIQFKKEVQLIDYRFDEVIVTTNDGTEYNASHVIFTPSLGVLKHQHSSMFIPMLPEMKQRAIEDLAIGSVNKLFLEFPHRWWPEDKNYFCFLWSDEDKEDFLRLHGEDDKWLFDVFIFIATKNQSKVLNSWVIGESSRYSETLSEETVLEKLYFLLQKFLGKTYIIPKPDKMIRSKWYSNEYFRGCYSFRDMKSEKMNVNAKDLAEPIKLKNGKPIILFGGEATHDHYYSTVHGAVESGFREADRLINFYNNT